LAAGRNGIAESPFDRFEMSGRDFAEGAADQAIGVVREALLPEQFAWRW
jgi:hypothetical protein